MTRFSTSQKKAVIEELQAIMLTQRGEFCAYDIAKLYVETKFNIKKYYSTHKDWTKYCRYAGDGLKLLEAAGKVKMLRVETKQLGKKIVWKVVR